MVVVVAEDLFVEDTCEVSCQSYLATRPSALSPPVCDPAIVVVARQKLVPEYMKADGLDQSYVLAMSSSAAFYASGLCLVAEFFDLGACASPRSLRRPVRQSWARHPKSSCAPE